MAGMVYSAFDTDQVVEADPVGLNATVLSSNPILPCGFELNPGNVAKQIDPIGRNTQLKNFQTILIL